jgi:hypothetical protein
MAIQVTGYYKLPSELICESPSVTLIPRLEYKGAINLEVVIGNYAILRYDIDKNTLIYKEEITDPYSKLIDALETFVINELQNSNEFNLKATYEHI